MIENENSNNSSLKTFYSNPKINKIKSKLQKEKTTQKLIKIISDLLSDISSENKPNKEENIILLKSFIMKTIPDISINDFLERLSKYSKASDEIFILTLIYIDRVCHYYSIKLNYNNIHKLILASFIISNKFLEDSVYSMQIYAKIGGVSVKEINHLEYEFLKLIKFNLFVDENLFQLYRENLSNLESDYNDSE